MRQGQNAMSARTLHGITGREMLRGVRERQELHNGLLQSCTMTANEALSLILQLTMRIFELANITALYVAGDNEHVSKIVEGNEAWLEKTIAEFDVQMMIDELYE